MPDLALCAAGRDQAARVGARLADVPLAAIHTSPVQRARETAAAIAAAGPHPAPVTADALDEIDFGDWTGRRFDALAGDPAWDAWNNARATAQPPGGEAMAAAQARIMAFAAAIAAQHDGATVACVSHCDMIRAALAGWLGLGLDHILRFDCDPASISRVSIGAWGARVVSINEGVA